MAVATVLGGIVVSWLCESSSTVRQGDHSGMFGISTSLLWFRLSSLRLGS